MKTGSGVLAAVCLLLSGCDQLQSVLFHEPEWVYDESGNAVIRIMSYNVQNLFDGIYDGDEYPQYDPRRSDWDMSGYHQRLAVFRDVIEGDDGRGPDVVLFQEIEKEEVLEDLAAGYLRRQGYDYIAATSVSGNAVEVGVISRIPLADIAFHQGQVGHAAAPRPVMEVVLELEWGTVHLFNSHWKSKVGGAQETEPQRLASAAAVRARAEAVRESCGESYILAAGDFNETPWEYERSGESCPTGLRIFDDEPEGSGACGYALFLTGEPKAADAAASVWYSPWLEDRQTRKPGTFVHQGEWEAIDHALLCENFFSGEGLEYRSMEVLSEGLLDEQGHPFSWDAARREGISDHLPVELHLSGIQ